MARFEWSVVSRNEGSRTWDYSAKNCSDRWLIFTPVNERYNITFITLKNRRIDWSHDGDN